MFIAVAVNDPDAFHPIEVTMGSETKGISKVDALDLIEQLREAIKQTEE